MYFKSVSAFQRVPEQKLSSNWLLDNWITHSDPMLTCTSCFLFQSFWFLRRCPVLNGFHRNKDEVTMVRCGFSRFVTDSCGQSIASSECVSLSQCTRDIRPHLKGFNVIDASLKSEIQLLWARAGTDSNYVSILLETFSMFYTHSFDGFENYIRLTINNR